MFLCDVFYTSLFYILYFVSNIRSSNCYLLSRANNSIAIDSMESRVSSRDVYQNDLLQTVGPHKHGPQSSEQGQYFYASTENKHIEMINSLANEKQIINVDSSNLHKISSTSSSQSNRVPEDNLVASSYQYEILLQPQNLHSSFSPLNHAEYYWRIPVSTDNLPYKARELSEASAEEKYAVKRNTQTAPIMQVIRPNINKNRYETMNSSVIPLEVYQVRPIGTSPSLENIYKYDPIHFSALYLEEPSYRKRSSVQNKLYNNENVITFSEPNYSQSTKISSTKITDQFQPPVSAEILELNKDNFFTPFINMMYLDNPGTYHIDNLKSVEGAYNFTPLKTPMLFYITTSSESSVKTRKRFNHFTPFLTPNTTEMYSDDSLAKVAEKLNKRNEEDVNTSTSIEELQKLIPYLISKASDSYNRQLTFEPARMQSTKSTRTTPDYWNIFWQIETRKNPETTHVLQLEPATTAKEAEGYWNEFTQTKMIEGSTQQFNLLRKTMEENTASVKEYTEEFIKSSVNFEQERWSSSSELEDHDHLNKRHRIFTSPTTPVLPAILKHFGRTNKVKSTSERNKKVFIGYKTLWKPKFTPSRTKPSFVDNTIPFRSSKILHWNFNDKDAAWPKVELVLSTTKKSQKSTKSRRTFPSYFPFYYRQKDSLLSTPLNIQATTHPQNENTDFLKKFPSIWDYESHNESVRQGKQRTNQCFECGLEDVEIPYYPTCFHIFNSANQQTRYKRVKFKKKCGAPRGCFKRFVDVGEIYNERGCREIPPKPGKSFASRRLARIEATLKDVANGCVTTPHASLTPFSRAISLFAKYHACVCTDKFCNTAGRVNTSVFIVLLNIYLSI